MNQSEYFKFGMDIIHKSFENVQSEGEEGDRTSKDYADLELMEEEE